MPTGTRQGFQTGDDGGEIRRGQLGEGRLQTPWFEHRSPTYGFHALPGQNNPEATPIVTSCSLLEIAEYLQLRHGF